MRRVVLKLAVAGILLTSASTARAAGQIGVIETGDNFRGPPQVMRARLWPLGKKGVPVHIRLMTRTMLNATPIARGDVIVSLDKHYAFFDSTATRRTAEGGRVYRAGKWGSAREMGVDDAELLIHFIAFSGSGAPKDSAGLVALWNKYEGKRK